MPYSAPGPFLGTQTASAYQVSRSLRFRSSASAYLKLANGTPTSARKWTWSGWVKRGIISSQLNISGAGQTSGTNYSAIVFNSGGSFQFNETTATTNYEVVTTQVFRDPSAWYHIVLAVDTTSATTTITGGSTDKIRLYINGSQVSSFSSTVVPALNYDTLFNSSGYTKAIGNIWYNNAPGGFYFDGYLAEVNFIDGQALTPSSFGAFDTNGVWQPAKYTGSYGTNGFYLNFSDNSGATATTIGKDSSGNSNNWTPNNISVTSGTTYDSMIDSPTNYADGGNGRGDYAVLNPLDVNVSNTQRPTDGNLTYPVSGAFQYSARSTIFVTSGKWYAEFTISSSAAIVAVVNSSALLYGYTAANGIFTSTTSIFNNGTQVQSGLTAFSANDVIGVAFDADANTVQFYRNGSTYGTAVTISAFSGPYTFQTGANGATCTINANFGQRPFAYTPPSGFSALNTQNLPAPALTPSP